MFREKKLPCDALIYLGTGFCPSGWNTENGSFSWNSRIFPDPQEMIEQLHKDNFHVVLHDVILTDKLRGTVHDPCDVRSFDAENANCYWDAHRKDFAAGVDGWWPDEGILWISRRAWRATGCIGKVRRSTGRMNDLTLFIATATPGCNATHRSCGPEMCTPPGRP
jgi:hypothetical protein